MFEAGAFLGIDWGEVWHVVIQAIAGYLAIKQGIKHGGNGGK